MAATTDTPRQSRWSITRTTRSRARDLRRDATDAERILWRYLRAHRMDGASFRRQTPIGPYIADFVCHAAQLVIELDGGQHYEAGQEQRDARRTAYLTSKGFRVVRFSNFDVMTNRAGVLETILSLVSDAPSPLLPRKRGREHAPANGEAQ